MGDNIWYPVFSPIDSTTSTVIFYSSYRGQNWGALPVSDEFSELSFDITFSNENDGFISGYDGITATSSDGGVGVTQFTMKSFRLSIQNVLKVSR